MWNRITRHWSVTGHKATAAALAHYNFGIDGDGQVHVGVPIEGNAAGKPLVAGKYAAHTRNLNSGNIGIAVLAMVGAQYAPFSWGSAPVLQRQIDAMLDLEARLVIEHGIEVSPRHVLSHAEVEPTLGVQQSGKWDFTVLPRTPYHRNPVAVGDELRTELKMRLGVAGMGKTLAMAAKAAREAARPVLRWGDKGEDVKAIQRAVGASVDGMFGPATYRRVKIFQEGHHLLPDGIVGPLTWAAIEANT